MKLTAIKRYIKIYITFLRFSLIFSMTYRFSFIIQLFVEFGYNFLYVFFFQVIYGNVREIAGWSYYEVLLLAGLNIITSELIISTCYAMNLKDLPRKIRRGNIDIVLTKPLNSLFTLSLSRPYLSGITASVSGFSLVFYALGRLEVSLTPVNIIAGVFILICGCIIAYSVLVILSSLSFVFINNTKLPDTGHKIIEYYKGFPHQIYQGIFRVIFFFLIPVVFVSSVPASTIIRGVEFKYIVIAPVLAATFPFLAKKIWDKMINYYSSASS